MNIEIANHLVQLRKKSGLSQEQLAEKLGLSRQSVSKWERAEASPDTDNLVALAKLYGVSLNELLMVDQPQSTQPQSTQPQSTQPQATQSQATQPQATQSQTDASQEEPKTTPNGEQPKEGVHIGFSGIHVDDGSDHVHVSFQNGVHVETPTDHVHVDRNGVFVQTEDGKAERHIFEHERRGTVRRVLDACYPVLTALVFLLLGACGWWHPGWMVFLTIPLYYTLAEAIRKRAPKLFAYPVLMAILYLAFGFFCGWWAWGWIVFLTIPIYYAIFSSGEE